MSHNGRGYGPDTNSQRDVMLPSWAYRRLAVITADVDGPSIIAHAEDFYGAFYRSEIAGRYPPGTADSWLHSFLEIETKAYRKRRIVLVTSTMTTAGHFALAVTLLVIHFFPSH